MHYSAVPGLNKSISVLGFGCSAVMGRTGRADSLRAMQQAFDAGVNFFDVARSYGGGEAEAVLGEFIRSCQNEVVVCTKFGILPVQRSGLKAAVLPIARKVVQAFPGLRKSARKAAGAQFVSGQFSVETLRSSLETSLRKLGIDTLDMLILHAAPPSAMQHDDLLAELEKVRGEGKIKVTGISGPDETLRAYAQHPPAVLTHGQFACNVFDTELMRIASSFDLNRISLVANHAFGGPLGVAETQRRIEDLRLREDVSSELKAKLDTSDPSLMPEIILQALTQSGAVSSVIVSMMNPANLKANLRAMETSRFTPDEISALGTALGLR